jgi:hypothetical protein
MTITLEKTKGYSGKNAGKTWIAEITKDGREFLQADSIEYGDGRDWFRKEKATREDTYEIGKNGLYEVCEIGDRHFRCVFTKADGSSGWMKVDDDRAAKMITLIETGSDSEEARLATRNQPL